MDVISMDVTSIGNWLSAFTGISAAIIGEHTIRRAVVRRLKATGLVNADAYLAHLLESEQEQDCLVELIVVPETWFFRDRQPFYQLKKHISKLIEAGPPDQPLRLLSAPCSSGEEPYSMAMTLLDMGLPSEAFQIDAIDICKHAIKKAREANYTKHSFRGVTELERSSNFMAMASGLVLKPKIRQTVRFQRSNLMTCLAENGNRYEVIFCRNLLIYLEDNAASRLLEAIATLLKPGGLLIVGSAEMAKVPTHLFKAIRQPFVFGFERCQPLPQAQAPVIPSETPRAPKPSRRSLASATPLPLPPISQAEELNQCLLRLQVNPYCDDTYLRMSQLLESSNQKEEALRSLQKCLYLKPRSKEALTQLIRLTRQLGQLEQSQRFEQRLARLKE
ncbi:MAG: CheR family methyltransferase [Synechococcus lacustris]